MNERIEIDCATADELAPAFGLGAIDAREAAAIEGHLAQCAEPHDDARELISAASLVPVALEPVAPSPGLRGRLMATVAETPQDHRPATTASASRVAPVEEPAPIRRPWWQLGTLPTAVATVAVAAAVGLGAWGATLNARLADRDAAIAAIAAADAIHAASGAAGSGWVIESDGQALFMSENLADLPADRLYEFWLIDAAGNATAAGTLTDTDGVALVTLEGSLDDATTFAVTVETVRVDQSVNDPVMVAALDA